MALAVKKRWKWVLAAVALPAACIGLLWVDSYTRAVAAIRAEDQRLTQDLAAFRARLKPGLPIDPAVEVTGLPCPLNLYRNPKRPRLEDGHSGHRDFYDSVFAGLFWLQERDEPPATADQILTTISIAHLLLGECGYDSSTMLHGYEQSALRAVPQALRRMSTKDELQRFAEALDLRLASRPTFADAMVAEHLMDRAEVLPVLHLRENPSGFIARPPGWRELFSWRIHLVKALTELDLELQRAKSGSGPETPHPRTTSAVAVEHLVRHASDEETRIFWTAARTAVEIAIFRAEHGRDPARLDELPRPPSGRPGGDRLSYSAGILTLHNEDGIAEQWVLRPK